jgi:hypothetical protein
MELNYPFPTVALRPVADILESTGRNTINHCVTLGPFSSARLQEWARHSALLTPIDCQNHAENIFTRVNWANLPPVEIIAIDSTVTDPLSQVVALLKILGATSCEYMEINVSASASTMPGNVIGEFDKHLLAYKLERTDIYGVDAAGCEVQCITGLYKRS